MAILHYDEFDNGVLEDFWQSWASGDSQLKEANSRVNGTVKKGEQIAIYQDALLDPKIDVWAHLEMKDNPQDECDLQFWSEDQVVWEGAISCSLAYHNVPGVGLGFYVWAWKYSDGWGELIEQYIPISQNHVYVRIRAIVNAPTRIFYATSEPERESDWTEIELPLTPDYKPLDFSLWITFNPYFTLTDANQNYYVDFVRYWHPGASRPRRRGLLPGVYFDILESSP